MLAVGDRVEAQWDDHKWYKGRVANILHTACLVVYDDGDVENNVPLDSLRLLPLDQPPPKLPTSVPKPKRNKMLAEYANAADVEAVGRLLAMNADPNQYDGGGFLPIHWACGPEDGAPADTRARASCIELLAAVTELGPDAVDRSASAMRPIEYAVIHNFMNCVAKLAQLGASLESCVHWAINSKSYGVLGALLQMDGCPYNAPSPDWDGCTPLMLAAGYGDEYATRMVLESVTARGVDPLLHVLDARQRSPAAFMPLHFATESGSLACVTLLLERGASVSAKTGHGQASAEIARKGLGRRNGDTTSPSVPRGGASPATPSNSSAAAQAEFSRACIELFDQFGREQQEWERDPPLEGDDGFVGAQNDASAGGDDAATEVAAGTRPGAADSTPPSKRRRGEGEELDGLTFGGAILEGDVDGADGASGTTGFSDSASAATVCLPDTAAILETLSGIKDE